LDELEKVVICADLVAVADALGSAVEAGVRLVRVTVFHVVRLENGERAEYTEEGKQKFFTGDRIVRFRRHENTNRK